MMKPMLPAPLLRLTQLCLIGCLALAGHPVEVQAQDSSRLPPSISQQQVLRLFQQQRYDDAFSAALHRFSLLTSARRAVS